MPRTSSVDDGPADDADEHSGGGDSGRDGSGVTAEPFDPGRYLRALRRRRVWSQRELAAAAGVSPSVVAAIEAGRRTPRLGLFERIVRAGGYAMVLVANETFADDAVALRLDDAHDAIRDRGERRFPAHLLWEGKPSYASGEREWWGWHRIAKTSDELVPDHVYWQRPREQRGPMREHPWFGQFRSRSGCHKPPDEPCASCAYLCDLPPPSGFPPPTDFSPPSSERTSVASERRPPGAATGMARAPIAPA